MWNPKPLPRTSLEPVCKALAGTIRRRRLKRGLSLNRLAAMTRLARQMLSFIETNRRVPTIGTVARISRAFGLPCSRLVAEAERNLD
jgi:transcriptional regulator with XRE-family HTH domain